MYSMEELLGPLPSYEEKCIDCGKKMIIFTYPGGPRKKRLCTDCKNKRKSKK